MTKPRTQRPKQRTKTVGFNMELVAKAAAVAPTSKFSQFAQTAVCEKIDRDQLLLAPLKRLSKGDER